ncbi:hypothetical protein PMAYCL1PPCAC_15936, partial [Pristionchus mayeri]
FNHSAGMDGRYDPFIYEKYQEEQHQQPPENNEYIRVDSTHMEDGSLFPGPSYIIDSPSTSGTMGSGSGTFSSSYSKFGNNHFNEFTDEDIIHIPQVLTSFNKGPETWNVNRESIS